MTNQKANQNATLNFSRWRGLPIPDQITIEELLIIKTKLNLLCEAIACLIEIPQEHLSRLAQLLQIELPIEEIFPLSNLSLASTADFSQGLAQVQGQTILVHNVAKQQQMLLRRAVGLIEQVNTYNTDLRQISLLKDYVEKFQTKFLVNGLVAPVYQKLYGDKLPIEQANKLAFKLLIELLFYSNNQGDRLLWSALVQQYQ
jgi:hypothetical protein